MHKKILILSFIFIAVTLRSQELVKPPTDLRTHNLTRINSSILNPAFSLDSNQTQSLSFWSRWQWQTIDTDPTTLFVSYNRQLNDKSAAGVSFFQNNTGLYLNIGALFNYAYVFKINTTTSLTLAANVSIFGQDIADASATVPVMYADNSIIAQVSPGVKLIFGSLGVSFAMENAFDYHFKLKESNTQEYSKVYTGLVSYDVPISLAGNTATVRPSIYIRDVPEFETQFGFIGSLHSDKYWGQLGYNNYYGLSFGGGVTIIKQISLGALVELESKIESKDPTLELVASYSFGKTKKPEEVSEEDQLEEADEEKEIVKVEKPKKIKKGKTKKIKKEKPKKIKKEKPEKVSKKELRKKRKEQELLEKEKKEKESLEAKQAEDAAMAKKRDDFIKNAKKNDSIVKSQPKKEELVETSKKVVPEVGEKYEEVKNEEGLEPGFYLIANVYKTKTYFNLFKNDLIKKGLNPKSFFRKKNGLNYIYLAKYNTMEEARKARKSSFNGRYREKTWIFRVVE